MLSESQPLKKERFLNFESRHKTPLNLQAHLLIAFPQAELPSFQQNLNHFGFGRLDLPWLHKNQPLVGSQP